MERASVGGADWDSADLEEVPSCPVCGSQRSNPIYHGLTDRVFRAAPGTWHLVGCGECGSAYLNPRPTEASIARAYASYYTHELQLAAPAGGVRGAVLNAYLKARWGYQLEPALPLGRFAGALFPLRTATAARELRHQHSNPGGKLLDVGAGSGAFVAYSRRLGWDAQGLEPDQAAVATAKAHGVPVAAGTLAQMEEKAGGFDAVTLSHVIEHFHDPARELRRIHRLLTGHGRIWIATPNLEAPGHRVFRGAWVGLDPPRHLVLFTMSSLVRLLRLTGFEPEFVPRPAPTAWQTFTQSGAIRDGRPLADGPSAGRRKTRFQAALADWLGYAAPRFAEELVVVARRVD